MKNRIYSYIIVLLLVFLVIYVKGRFYGEDKQKREPSRMEEAKYTNNKKEIEREELHKTIWKIANELRGSVDGWDFKQYVLGLLFYRFISENIENYVNENQSRY